MWGNKKPDTPQAAQPEPVNPIINQPPKPAPATWEEKPAMSTDSMRPLSATSDRSSARLGSSLHVKGEISGSEDLLIDGSVEGLIQLDERKLDPAVALASLDATAPREPHRLFALKQGDWTSFGAEMRQLGEELGQPADSARH